MQKRPGGCSRISSRPPLTRTERRHWVRRRPGMTNVSRTNPGPIAESRAEILARDKRPSRANQQSRRNRRQHGRVSASPSPVRPTAAQGWRDRAKHTATQKMVIEWPDGKDHMELPGEIAEAYSPCSNRRRPAAAEKNLDGVQNDARATKRQQSKSNRRSAQEHVSRS